MSHHHQDSPAEEALFCTTTRSSSLSPYSICPPIPHSLMSYLYDSPATNSVYCPVIHPLSSTYLFSLPLTPYPWHHLYLYHYILNHFFQGMMHRDGSVFSTVTMEDLKNPDAMYRALGTYSHDIQHHHHWILLLNCSKNFILFWPVDLASTLSNVPIWLNMQAFSHKPCRNMIPIYYTQVLRWLWVCPSKISQPQTLFTFLRFQRSRIQHQERWDNLTTQDTTVITTQQ